MSKKHRIPVALTDEQVQTVREISDKLGVSMSVCLLLALSEWPLYKDWQKEKGAQKA